MPFTVPADAAKGNEPPYQPGPQDGITNDIRLTLYHGVTAQEMAQLRAIAGDEAVELGRGAGQDEVLHHDPA